MKKLVFISFSLLSIIGFSQKQVDELAVVKSKPVVVKVDVIDEYVKSEKSLPVLSLKASIQKGFQTANVKLLSIYFASNIDMSMLDNENLYSKSQAEQVLKTFFTEHKPTKFSLVHEGSSVSTKYYIGSLKTIKGDFRITVNTKIISSKELISHLTIEEDN